MWASGGNRRRPLLEVQDIYAGYYAGQDVLRGVTLDVHEGEIVCVIGCLQQTQRWSRGSTARPDQGPARSSPSRPS